ncbi:MAG: MFS transporter [Thermoplasmata archaeon]
MATFFWGVSVGLISATLPFRFQQLGIPIFAYGLTLGVYAAGALATESVWGALAFHLGRPPTIVGLGVIVGGATLLLAFATTLLVFLVAISLLGAVGVFLAPLLRWVAFGSGGPGSEGRGAGRWSAAFGLGIALGVTVGPLEFVTYGFHSVALTSIVMLAVAVGAAATLPWSRAALPSADRGQRRALSSLVTPPFLLSLGMVTIAFTAMTFTTNFLQYYSIVVYGGTPPEAGFVLGAARIVMLVASLLLGTLVDRWARGRSIPAGFVLVLLGALATWASRSYDEMIGATLVFSAGIGWLFASMLPFALSSVPRDHQGTAIGVFGSVEDLGLLIGPLVFGAVWAAFGPTGIFPVVTALAGVGVVVSLLVYLPDRGMAPPVAASVQAGRDPD